MNKISSYTLRPWSAADAAGFREAVDESLGEFRPWLNWAHLEPASIDVTAARLSEYAADFAAGVRWRYAIVENETQAIVGGATLHKRIGPGGRDIGYWLRTSSTGKGIMSAVVAALVRLAFVEHSVETVEIHCDRGNDRSAAVPERLGFKLAGETLRELSTGEKRICRIYRMTKSEFPTKQLEGIKEPQVAVSI